MTPRTFCLKRRQENTRLLRCICPGNVRQKLAEAEKAAKYSGRFKRNVEALKAVIPEDIGPARISPQLGAAWIPAEVYTSFVTDVLGAGFKGKEIYYQFGMGSRFNRIIPLSVCYSELSEKSSMPS